MKLQLLSLFTTTYCLLFLTSCSAPVYRGCLYEGERRNNIPDGHGLIHCPHNGIIYTDRADYVGGWKNGMRHGEGTAWVRDPLNYKQILGKYNVKCDNDICRDTKTGITIPIYYSK